MELGSAQPPSSKSRTSVRSNRSESACGDTESIGSDTWGDTLGLLASGIRTREYPAAETAILGDSDDVPAISNSSVSIATTESEPYQCCAVRCRVFSRWGKPDAPLRGRQILVRGATDSRRTSVTGKDGVHRNPYKSPKTVNASAKVKSTHRMERQP